MDAMSTFGCAHGSKIIKGALNCHGFNAGTAAYLHRACKSVDVLLLQETWLSDVNCGKIGEFLRDFDVFHTSAMEHLVFDVDVRLVARLF